VEIASESAKQTLPARRPPFPVGVDLVEENERRAKLRERVWSSLTVLVSATIVSLAALRLLAVSHFNLSTALAILNSTTTTTVAFGALLIALPYIVVTLTAQVGIAATSAGGTDRVVLWTRYALGALIAFLIIPPLQGISIAVPLLFVGFGWIAKRRKARNGRHAPKPPDTSWARGQKVPDDRELRHYRDEFQQAEAGMKAMEDVGHLTPDLREEYLQRLSEISHDGNVRLEKINKTARIGMESATLATIAAFLPAILQYLSFGDRPWMPAEVVSLNQGQASVVGYVLKQDVKWMTILRESDRSIVYLATPDTRAREVCKLPRVNDDQRSMIAKFNNAVPNYRECPAS
jgi:hypothetical protein